MNPVLPSAQLAAWAALMSVLLLTGCDRQRDVRIEFVPTLAGAPLACPTDAGITNVQFFVSEVELRNGTGQWRPVTLDAQPAWQNEAVALMSNGDCAVGQSHLILHGRWQGDRIAGLRFTLGVPDDLNHLNPLRASSPLNVASMFWTWQQGYKFIRLDGRGAAGGWALHLGSTGCQSPAAVRPPTEPCQAGNRSRIMLTAFSGGAPVNVRLDDLVAALTEPEPISCTDQYARNPRCVSALRLFGLDAISGSCQTDPCEQTVFSLADNP